MASCLKPVVLWTPGAGFAKVGEMGVGLALPSTYATSLIPDATVTDLSQCQVVALTGADYVALKTPAPTDTGAALNVTADIFVGAALVLCLALGWIAGAQR